MGDAKESRGMCGCIISKNGVREKDGCTDLCNPRHLRRLPHADETLCWEPRSADILCSVKGQGWKELLAVLTHFPLLPESPHPDSGLSFTFSPLSLAFLSLLSTTLSSSRPCSIQHAYSSSVLLCQTLWAPRFVNPPLVKPVLLWCPFPLLMYLHT